MIRTSQAVALLCLLAVSATPTPLTGEQGPEVVVDGFVRDTADRPIAGVKVSMYPLTSSSAAAQTETNQDGRYQLRKNITTTYHLFFSHSTLDVASIAFLAEGRDQRISIKMYKRGEKRPVVAYNDSLNAIDRLHLMIASADKAERRGLEDAYLQMASAQLLDSGSIDLVVNIPTSETRAYLSRRRELVSKTRQELEIKLK